MIPAAIVRREVLRALGAFAVFLLLRPVWVGAGIDRAYQHLVLRAASAVFLPLQHFPLIQTLDTLRVTNLDPLMALVIALFLVSWDVPLRLRAARFGAVAACVFALHVVCFLLDLKLRSAEELLAQQQLLILLPVEFHVLERLKYLAYDLGIEAWPMVLVGLTAFWNGSARLERAHAAAPARRRSAFVPKSRRRRAWAAAAVAALVLPALAFGAWTRWREANPLHVAAHARLGQLYLANRSPGAAEEQFRIAARYGTSDASVYYELGSLSEKRGDRRDAESWFRRGLANTTDPHWRAQLDAALNHSAR